jgi:hypothetical protein
MEHGAWSMEFIKQIELLFALCPMPRLLDTEFYKLELRL